MSKHKNTLRVIVQPLIISLTLIVGIMWGRVMMRNQMSAQIGSFIENLTMPRDTKLGQTLSLIDRFYVDSISLDSIQERVIPMITKELDPHSVYVPAKEMAQMNESLEGEFDGIGVVFNMATDTVIVLNVIPSGPSDKAGIKARDRIIEINDTIVAGQKIAQSDIVKRLRGVRGSKVKLSLERWGADELVEVEVVRDAIPIESIESAFMLEPEVAYIKMSQFARTTHSELTEALATLTEQGMESLILDLRGNPGGYLDQAIAITNEFLPEGELIVYTEDREGKRVTEYSNGRGGYTNLKVAVLIDESSASSSEILSGALQDNDRATIIGRRSFGKGLVQRQIPYSDGSAIRLTTARYYTPTGRSIQKPYTMGDDESYNDDLYNRYTHNELFTADSIHFADSLKKVTPKGKVVYGGGGIMPDVFIPIDTTNVTNYYVEVSARNILYRYTIEYTDKHQQALKELKSLGELTEFFDNDRTLVDDFISYASRQGVKPKWADIKRSRALIESQLRAYIGRNTTLSDDGFYINIYPQDKVMVRAVEELRK